MSTLPKSRIQSVDLLKGIVMVIMALDDVRDYVHFSAHYFNPIDPEKSTLPIYFTRLTTDYCAPTFSFLAGLSAFFAGKRKSVSELSRFLFTRGLWLVFIEISVVSFGWYFDIFFRNTDLAVIWCLGVSMIVLGGLVYLPKNVILIFSCVVIFGHNLLDNVHFPGSIIWSMVHDSAVFQLSKNFTLTVIYPVVPWIGVMSLGYCFGSIYGPSYNSDKRRRLLNVLGLSVILLFIIVRWINIYGDPIPFEYYPTLSKTTMSFLNVNKYPPSLLYLAMTLGPAFIFLANSEKLKGRIVDFFSTFGRVPFFYYVLHLYVIHLMAMALAQFSGFGWQKMILDIWVPDNPELKGYGFGLWVVYLVWITAILICYPLCKKFDTYKQNHKDKRWLSYL